jgi:hypothetical protein
LYLKLDKVSFVEEQVIPLENAYLQNIIVMQAFIGKRGENYYENMQECSISNKTDKHTSSKGMGGLVEQDGRLS